MVAASPSYWVGVLLVRLLLAALLFSIVLRLRRQSFGHGYVALAAAALAVFLADLALWLSVGFG